jgi:hypothetical protein
MIISRLEGGLGNQMFQYAAARRLSEKHLTPLKLDITGFETQKHRRYKLLYFNIWEHLATAQEITELIGDSTFHERLAAKIGRKLGFYQSAAGFYQKGWVFKEEYFHFNPDLLDAPYQVYMEGFWQSEKYFLDIADLLRQEFTLKYPQPPIFHQILEEINNATSVSLHVRRGDYIDDPNNLLLSACSLDYYRSAIKYISEHVCQPHFFIFSDSPDWVRENLCLNFSKTIVSYNNLLHDYEELYLMSQCQHHIIANSSFSWWGAWLNPKNNKAVVAPSQWFRNSDINTKDLIPETWIRL